MTFKEFLKTTGGVFVMVVAVIIVIVGCYVGVWLISGPKGAADQDIINNDGRNRINSQEWFEGQMAQIKAADKNLDEAASNLAKHPNDDFYQTNYSGLKNRCNEMVQNYNAESRKVSRGDWRTSDLPYSIDGTDPSTDCKESAK